jgi:hypothetical protein
VRVLGGGGREFTLAAGLAHTLEWYLREGRDRREIDFSAEDRMLHAARGASSRVPPSLGS